MAGTTAICALEGARLKIVLSQKNQDADLFIKDFISTAASECQIFLDAPLSLPIKYLTGEGTDYFYRKADKEMKAMSPMFLGGLTARAIQLKDWLEASDHQVLEAYPAAAAKRLSLENLDYKKKEGDIDIVSAVILTELGLELKTKLKTWHEVDALIAYWIGIQYLNGNCKTAGDPQEGLIHY